MSAVPFGSGHINDTFLMTLRKDDETEGRVIMQRMNKSVFKKPVELMEYLVKTYTNKGDTVLDFTMGSGTTGIACKNTNRNFIGIELDENYFKIAEKRIKGEK